MANKPIDMNKLRHLIQLYFQGRSKLLISHQTGIARNTLKKYLKVFYETGLTYSQMNSLSDKELEDLFIKSNIKPMNERLCVLFDLFPSYDKEMRKKGMTRQNLWHRYKEDHPEGLGRSQFNHYFALWKKQVNPKMHIEHKAGDKLYVDFAGKKPQIVDRHTGHIKEVEFFVAILGASQLTYAQAAMTQQKEDFVDCCQNALQYFGGVPSAIVPDNLKSAVVKSSKYEAIINPLFADFAHHYGTTILPARAHRPRDKALVENMVRILYARIYTKLNEHNYGDLDELNQAILIALEWHNNQLLTSRPYSRRQQFEEVEKLALMPLPALRYEIKKIVYITVMKNGHVCLSADKHYYSVPYRFIGKKVKLMYNQQTVEIFYNYERIAVHQRIQSPYNYTTDKEHLASAHRFVTEWTAERFISWAESIHEDVGLYILKVLDQKQHPEQSYKSCLGILSFTKKVGNDRLIKACQRALGYGLYNYKTIQKILLKGLETQEEDSEPKPMPSHDNIRGDSYYQ
jgi:transposase